MIPSVIQGFSGDVLDAILHEWKPTEPIIDLTYGIGNCWKKTCGEHYVIGLDIDGFKADIIGDARFIPLINVNSAFFDPPYAKMGKLYECAKGGDKSLEHYNKTSQIKDGAQLKELLKKTGFWSYIG